MKKIIAISLLTLAMGTTVFANEITTEKNSNDYFMMSSEAFQTMYDYMKDQGMSEDTLEAMKNFMSQEDRSFGGMMGYMDKDNLFEMFSFMANNSGYLNGQNTTNEYSNNNENTNRNRFNMMGFNNGYSCHGNYR